MNKVEKIISLTTNKTQQLVLTLNYDLIQMLKKAAKKNNVKITHLIETFVIKYLDTNGFLD